MYRERKENLVLVPQIGPDGKEVWIKDTRTGQPLRQRFVRVLDSKEPFIFDEFQLQDLGNGVVKKNRNFRAPPGEEYAESIPTPSQDELVRKVAELENMIAGLISGDLISKKAAQEAEYPEPDEDKESDPEVAVPEFVKEKR